VSVPVAARSKASLQRTDYSSRGVLPTGVCLSEIMKPREKGGPGPLGAVAPW
jgi:hypothetical protein